MLGSNELDGANLTVAMLARADIDGLPDEHDLRIKANEFNDAAKGFFGEPQICDMKRFLGCWARARRAWCDYTGEALV